MYRLVVCTHFDLIAAMRVQGYLYKYVKSKIDILRLPKLAIECKLGVEFVI